MDLRTVDSVLALLNTHSVAQFLYTFLHNSRYDGHHSKQEFLAQWPFLMELLASHPLLQVQTQTFAVALVTGKLKNEVATIAEKESGWHFSAKNVHADQLDNFTIDGMAHKIQLRAPILSTLVAALLDSDPERTQRQARFSEEKARMAEDSCAAAVDVDWSEEDEYWWDADLDVGDMDAGVGDGDQGMGEGSGSGDSKTERLKKRRRRAEESRARLLSIRRVIIISIMMFSTNQKCNALPAVLGIFLHSTSTPELVIEVLAHAGLSVSVSTNHNMVNSLSRSSQDMLRRLAERRMLAFAYDNFDMAFKSWLATIENSQDSLKHATSALAFELEHEVIADDLEHCTPMWATNPLNRSVPEEQHRPQRSWLDLLAAPSANAQRAGLTVRLRAWHFRHALVTYVQAFERFRGELGLPETVLQIPVKKTTHVPCRAMDINQSTADGQSDILESLFAQANIGDPSDNPGVVDIREHMVLIHGDLGTGERLEGATRSRSIERKPVRGLRNVVFVFGLFHLQMACTEAIWRMFIQPKDQQSELNGLYQQACKVRPRDSGRIGSKPGFRLMHDLILQCSAARMLDIWRVEIEKRFHKTLDEYATSATWSEIEKLSLSMAAEYVEKPTAKDQEFRNNSLILARLLDYVELAHAMKHGDVGRAEATFLRWVYVFKSVGKHKYAAQIIKTMLDLKYVYPERLAKAVRLNWLLNPTGQVDGFRAVDWLVELMNLYIKVVYASSGYARTFQLVLKQSPLIEVFRRVHKSMQNNFHLLHRTIRHAPPNLHNTIQALRELLRENRAHENIADRKSYALTDHMRRGLFLLQTTTTTAQSGEESEEKEEEIDITEEDMEVAEM